MTRLRFGPVIPSRSRTLMAACGLVLVVCVLTYLPAVAQDTGQAPTPESPFSVWISPTPDASGVIAVVVQPDESLWVIAARAGLTLPDLLTLNNLTENDVIRPGDVIIIGTGTPPPTAISPEQLTPTITPPPPTLRPTQPPAAATICLIAFEDTNQDGIQNAGEPPTAGVAFTVFNRDTVVANIITDGRTEPHCVQGLAPGEYYVTRSILPGERLTSDGDWALAIADNSTLLQAFGSVRAPSTPAPTEPPAVASNEAQVDVPPADPVAGSPAATGFGDDPLLWGGVGLLFVGGLLLLSAVLILLYRRMRAKS